VPAGRWPLIVAFREDTLKHTLLPLDDCLYTLQATIPHVTRSSLHRCLQRHGISRLPDVEDGSYSEHVPNGFVRAVGWMQDALPISGSSLARSG